MNVLQIVQRDGKNIYFSLLHSILSPLCLWGLLLSTPVLPAGLFYAGLLKWWNDELVLQQQDLDPMLNFLQPNKISDRLNKQLHTLAAVAQQLLL